MNLFKPFFDFSVLYHRVLVTNLEPSIKQEHQMTKAVVYSILEKITQGKSKLWGYQMLQKNEQCNQVSLMLVFNLEKVHGFFNT